MSSLTELREISDLGLGMENRFLRGNSDLCVREVQAACWDWQVDSAFLD